MKLFWLHSYCFGVTIAILLTNLISLAIANDHVVWRNNNDMEKPVDHQPRLLTAEEEALANEARTEIAKSIENNLIRLFAVITARNNRRSRQEDGTSLGGVAESESPSPNVLPQVAQLIGAILSGSFNVTGVVERTYGLVPNILRNQVGGLVKLLTGENMENELPGSRVDEGSHSAPISSTTSPNSQTSFQNSVVTVIRVIRPGTATKLVRQRTQPVPTKVKVQPQMVESTTIKIVEQTASSSSRPKYKFRSRTRSTSTTIRTVPLIEDDEIEKLEEEIRLLAAKRYKSYFKEPNSKSFVATFRDVFKGVDTNSPDITRVVPTIFEGTAHGFGILKNLGLV